MAVTIRLLAALALALAAFAGWQTVRLADERVDHQKTVAQLERERGDWQRESRVAVEAARTEEHRRTAVAEKESNHARNKSKTLADDLASARAAGERLRVALAAAQAARGNSPGKPAATADGSPPADPAGDLLANVQRRLDEAADGIAGFADKAHLAGLTCERIYDQMTPPARSPG